MATKIFSRWLVLLSPLAFQRVQSLSAGRPLYKSTIDYSAANDYIEEHYGLKSYFPGAGENDEKSTEQPVWNGRELKGLSLEQDGFVLLEGMPKLILNQETITRQSSDSLKALLQSTYLTQLRDRLEDMFSPGSLQEVIFWHPMLRGERLKIDAEQKTSSIARLVHIDTDVDAYELDQLVRLITKNQINAVPVSSETVGIAIQNRQRFLVVNAWRSIRPGALQRAPLGLYVPRYTTTSCFPHSRPDLETSRWYTFPGMTSSEILLFKQYDRRMDRVSDIWHCALEAVHADDAPPRLSLDVRAFCILKETIDDTRLDRYRNRVAANLSLEESGCFCNEQEEKHRVGQ